MTAQLPHRPARPGRVTAADGLLIEAEGLDAPTGTLCRIHAGRSVEAEVVGFRTGRVLLVGEGAGLAPGLLVEPLPGHDRVPVGPALLGRVVDALGCPLDGRAAPAAVATWPLAGVPLPSLGRSPVTERLATGVRAIDALLTVGVGQRVGLIAGSGVGKSVLLGQIVRGTTADAIVVALIGERGREVRDFIDRQLGAALARAHVVAVPADAPMPQRLRGLGRAHAVAEWLSAQGRSVLLVVDSLTRAAHAARDVALALGEAPGAGGWPPSALGLIGRVVERAGGDARSSGAITAIYTVLADGDDVVADPVVDAARGVLDGHIVLSRSVAARGRYPAIDLAASISRLAHDLTGPVHRANAVRFRRLHMLAEASRDLVAMGACVRGADAEADGALDRWPALEALLAQPIDALVSQAEADAALTEVVA